MNNLKRCFKLYRFRKKWKKKNRHNYTLAANMFDMDKVSVGNYSYGSIEMYSDDPTVQLIIGSYCSIGKGTIFLLGEEHHMDTISTYPFRAKILKKNNAEAFSKGNIIVGNDVWFGQRTTILSGVKIGQGAVIATGAIVTKDVPPYAIVAGSPAKVVKYRFNKDIIEKLLEIDFSKINKNNIIEIEDELYQTIDIINIDNILDSIREKV